MFLTLTANSALDRILFIEEFVSGKTMRTGDYLDAIGGKGLDVSVVQQNFHIDTFALAFIAGYNGKQLAQMVDQAGIPSELVWVEGETRISHIIVETHQRIHSHIVTSGYSVNDEDCGRFITAYQGLLPKAEWVIGAGTLPNGAPRDLYAEITRLAHEAGKPVLIDCFGPPANSAIRSRPTIMKMNRHELAVTFSLPSSTIDEIRQSAGTLRAKYDLNTLVVTLGEDGVLAVTKEGSWRAFGPRQVEVNGTGAGEAVSAVLPWRLSLGDPLPEALRWASAAGAATVLSKASAEVHLTDFDRLLMNTQVLSI